MRRVSRHLRCRHACPLLRCLPLSRLGRGGIPPSTLHFTNGLVCSHCGKVLSGCFRTGQVQTVSTCRPCQGPPPATCFTSRLEDKAFARTIEVITSGASSPLGFLPAPFGACRPWQNSHFKRFDDQCNTFTQVNQSNRLKCLIWIVIFVCVVLLELTVYTLSVPVFRVRCLVTDS